MIPIVMEEPRLYEGLRSLRFAEPEIGRSSLAEDRLCRVTRLLRIITLVRSTRRHGLKDLAEACECSTKTIQRDIGYWMTLGVRLEYDQKKRGYVLYGSLPFKLLDLNVAEISALALAEAAVLSSGNHDMQTGIASAFDKVRGLVPDDMIQRLDGCRDSLLRSGEAKRDYSHAPLTVLLEACRSHEAVEVDYDSLTSGRRIRPIEPYRVAFLDGFWMVIARDPSHDDVRCFALDRIHSCVFLKPKRGFRIPDGWTLSGFTANSVGVLHGEDTDITLRFAADAGVYALARRWRFPHKLDGPAADGTVTLYGTVAGLEEITWEVLRWGRHVTVLAPEALRRRVADEARAILEYYR